MKFFLLILVAISTPGLRGYCDELNVSAEVNRSEISVGSSLQLTITVEGSKSFKSLELPDIEGFEIVSSQSSTDISIVNGSYSKSNRFHYTLLALEEGEFTIPGLSISAGGSTYTTEPIEINVTGTQQLNPPSDDGSGNINEKVFLTLEVDKEEVYLNEPVGVTVKLYISDIAVRVVEYPQFDNPAIKLDGFKEHNQYQQVIGGIRYQVIEFNSVVYPTREGNLELGPVRLKCNLLKDSGDQRRRFGNRLNDFFNDDIFDNFFRSYEKHPVVLASERKNINVLPLPKQGKPKGFNNTVGKFNFEAEISPTNVKVGDPITLRMKIGGKGNLDLLEFPRLMENDDIKLYEPNIKEENGIKSFEQVVIPKNDRIKKIPSLEFSYFDPELKQYQTIVRGPFPIEVTSQGTQEDLAIIGTQRPVEIGVEEFFGKDIVYLKSELGSLKRKGYAFYNYWWFYFILMIISAFWVGGFVYYKRTHKLETDIVYAKRLHAPRFARKSLGLARKSLSEGNTLEFYDHIYQTLQLYLRNKLHLSPGAVSTETLMQHKLLKDVNKENIKDIELALEECSQVRYASVKFDERKMQESYQRCELIIDYLERHLK